ncbi:MAG: hypothetical protein LBC75_09245 [Fibromonadaceae bacterium]|jgi:hypothetical protein|nr:hypothetical protein [Fibromonadaceae bacterium]
MNKKLIFAVLASCSLIFATENSEQEIENRVEILNAKKGLEISGTVRSASFNSYFESRNEKPDSTGTYTNKMPNHEISEFLQLDLDFKFRPWDVISANLKLRLGAGAQEYFAAAATMVSVPWMNIEGNLTENFYWVVGDFRQSYSPLTLYMPGIDIMYEPTAFARKREMAQKEALIQGNQRNLQGFNLQYRPQLGEKLGELRVEALGARLRRAGYLDASGAMGNMLPNEGIPGATQAGRFDKFLLAGNLELLPLNKNLLIGGTYLSIFDDENSSKKYSCPENICRSPGDRDSLINTLDSIPQKTSIIAGRAGADIAGILGNSSLVANLTAEFAMSKDESPELEEGKAILAQMDLGYKGILNTDIVLSSSFIRNDSSWFNNVAQSPSFFARRVLNSDKDLGCRRSPCTDQTYNLSKYGVYSPLYSSFDALYFFTPKHSPMRSTFNSTLPEAGDQNMSYNNSPYAKTSWNPSTLTRAELALLENLSDLNLQMALPGGFATPNRMGFQEVLTANWKGLAEVKGLFASYKQLAAGTAEIAKYTEFGGGAKVDLWGVELSGSYKGSAKEQGTAEYTSDFINAGLYYRFYKRFGLAFGFQQINSDLNESGANILYDQMNNLNLKISVVPIIKAKQNQWMAGLDYTVAKNAWLSINYGIMSVENTYQLTTIKPETNMPGYAVVNVIGKEIELKHEFSRNILEATINVEF